MFKEKQILNEKLGQIRTRYIKRKNQKNASESRKGKSVYELNQREDQCDKDVRRYVMQIPDTL